MSQAPLASGLVVPPCTPFHLDYTTVAGVFQQDDPQTDADGFDYVAVNFGLIDRTYASESTPEDGKTKTQWERFASHVDALNTESPEDVAYKVLFLGRHGEGFHNVAESFYGTPAWNCYWAQQEGNGTVTWADALLTETGVAQARRANDFWRSLLSDEQRIPAPQVYYTSPLTRCLQTAHYSFSGLPLPADRPFAPTIKEFLREDISTHTCDRRATRSAIQARLLADDYMKDGEWRFEPGFAEADELWHAETGETPSAQRARSRIVLDQIFTENWDGARWISITSHSGEIASLLEVLGHRPFWLGTGQAIPVLVKARRRYQAYPSPTTVEAWTPEATCEDGPPVTSLPGESGGCVCAPTEVPDKK